MVGPVPPALTKQCTKATEVYSKELLTVYDRETRRCVMIENFEGYASFCSPCLDV